MKLVTTYSCKIIAVLILILCSKTIFANGDSMQITETMAIDLANKAAKHLGYNVDSLRVKATHYTTSSNEYIPADSNDEYVVERRNKLQNKKYWAVYYYDPQYRKGGDLTIFIDSSNGAMITDIRGK